MDKTHNWGVKLRDAAAEYRGREFVWGETDCVSFLREMLTVMFDEDILGPRIRRNWSTKKGAMRAFKENGSVEDALRDMGAYEVSVAAFRDGDVLILPGDGYENVAIKAGGKVFTSSPAKGVYAEDGIPDSDFKVYRV